MFNERSPKWIKIYKGFVTCVFILIILLGLILPLNGSFILIKSSRFINYLLVFTIIAAAAGMYLILNMLIIGALSDLRSFGSKKDPKRKNN